MNVKELKKKWMLAQIRPELFYIPFKSKIEDDIYCIVNIKVYTYINGNIIDYTKLNMISSSYQIIDEEQNSYDQSSTISMPSGVNKQLPSEVGSRYVNRGTNLIFYLPKRKTYTYREINNSSGDFIVKEYSFTINENDNDLVIEIMHEPMAIFMDYENIVENYIFSECKSTGNQILSNGWSVSELNGSINVSEENTALLVYPKISNVIFNNRNYSTNINYSIESYEQSNIVSFNTWFNGIIKNAQLEEPIEWEFPHPSVAPQAYETITASEMQTIKYTPYLVLQSNGIELMRYSIEESFNGTEVENDYKYIEYNNYGYTRVNDSYPGKYGPGMYEESIIYDSWNYQEVEGYWDWEIIKTTQNGALGKWEANIEPIKNNLDYDYIKIYNFNHENYTETKETGVIHARYKWSRWKDADGNWITNNDYVELSSVIDFPMKSETVNLKESSDFKEYRVNGIYTSIVSNIANQVYLQTIEKIKEDYPNGDNFPTFLNINNIYKYYFTTDKKNQIYARRPSDQYPYIIYESDDSIQDLDLVKAQLVILFPFTQTQEII